MMKIKRKIMIGLLLVLSLLIGTKIYSEIDAAIYENKTEKMNILKELKMNANHKTLKIDDFEIHYYVSGNDNKDLIVFLHPAFSDHRAFAPQIDFFSKKYKVITIDLIGHGLSKANKSKDKIDASSKHINKILEIEGFEKAHLVGVSMGSLIAQYFALEYPDKVRSLTALGGYNINKDDKEVAKAQRSYNLKLVFTALFSMKAFRKTIAENTCKSEKGQAMFYQTSSYYERKSFMVMQGLQNVIKDRENIKPQYPILMLVGEYDIELSKRMAKEWHNDINNSEYKIIKDAGHCANMDKALEFNSLLMKFIENNN